MAAMIASRDVYMKAYGTPKTAMIHAQATFGGIGEACVTAIEGLNVMYDEDLIGNAERVGSYLIERLNELKAKYPQIIKDVRGSGFMVGLEFQDFSQTLPALLRPMVALLDVTVLVGTSSLDPPSFNIVMIKQRFVATGELLRILRLVHRRRHSITPMESRNTTQLPQRVLKSLAEALQAFGETDRSGLPVRPRKHEVIDQVIELTTRNRYTELPHAGEV